MSVLYVYGLVRDDFAATRLPTGLDDAVVTVQQAAGVSALVSHLSPDTYSASAVERNSGDVSWLSPRAMAHDRVLTWAQEHGGVVPLPMFTLFGSDAAFATAMASRAATVATVFQRVGGADEFGVRVYRRDEEMRQSIEQMDPTLSALRAEADVATPGQRYLLERKITDQRKSAIRAAGQRMAREIFSKLQALSREALSRPPVPEAARDQEATLVLNGAFLVDRARGTAFRAAVAECLDTYGKRGLAFDFTGPWPPYNFVGDASPRTASPSTAEGR